MTFCELPVTHREATQKLRRSSKFAAFIDDEEDAAAADASAPTVASASDSASASHSASFVETAALIPTSSRPATQTRRDLPHHVLASLGRSESNSGHGKVSPKKEEKRYAHELKKAVEESDRPNRKNPQVSR